VPLSRSPPPARLPGNSILNIAGTLNLNNQSETVDQITGNGTLDTGTSATNLVVGANNGSSAFSGSIIGSAGLTKYGAGTFVLAGADSFTGPVNLGGGATSGGNVDGILQITSAAALAGATQVNFKDNNSAYATFAAEQQHRDDAAVNTLVPAGTPIPMELPAPPPPSSTALAGNNVINGAMSFTTGGGRLRIFSGLRQSHFRQRPNPLPAIYSSCAAPVPAPSRLDLPEPQTSP